MTIFDGKTALIIEDDMKSIEVLQQLLLTVDIPSEIIYDSFHVANKISEAGIPDVVFLDLEMPQSNGYTVLEILKGDSKFDGVPVVAYTTHTSHLNQAKQAGFHSFLGKPLDGRQFADNLAKILNGESIWEIPG